MIKKDDKYFISHDVENMENFIIDNAFNDEFDQDVAQIVL